MKVNGMSLKRWLRWHRPNYALVVCYNPCHLVRNYRKDKRPSDWRRLPWHLACWLWALVWTHVWYPAWGLRSLIPIRRFKIPLLPCGGGRHVDPDPIMCPSCWWAGMARWLTHGYVGVGYDDVEPADWCPRCGFPFNE